MMRLFRAAHYRLIERGKLDPNGPFPDASNLHENQRRGYLLCGRCGGTGNELAAFYRACHECSGSGIHPSQKRFPSREVLGFRTRQRIGRACSRVRVWFSRWTGGSYFGNWETCHRCGVEAYEVDYWFKREGMLRRSACGDFVAKECAERQAEMAAPTPSEEAENDA